MMLRMCLICAWFAILAPLAQAQQICPWLTQGTAAKLMGGPVTADVQATTASEGVCVFTRSTTGDSVVLRIVIGPALSAVCLDGDHLRGVGDQAIHCATDKPNEHREAIQGNVRATQFALTLTARGPSVSPLPKNTQRSATEQLAEEVAGSLF